MIWKNILKGSLSAGSRLVHESQNLLAQVKQKIKAEGKELDKQTKKQLKAESHELEKLLTKFYVDKVTEEQISKIRQAKVQLEQSASGINCISGF